MKKSLPVARRLVGSLLRQYRQAHGYKLEEAASILECDPSKISRIETGERGIRPDQLSKLLTDYGVDTETQAILVALAHSYKTDGWWWGCRNVLPGPVLDFSVTEGLASRIMIYAPLQVPEVLWTMEYGTAVCAADLSVPDGAETAAVDAVIAHRSALLFDRAPECTVVLGEAALRRQIGNADIMRRQLTRLFELSGAEYPWLSIRVLPFNAGAHAAGGTGAFSVLQFDQPSDLGLVHISGAAGGVCLDGNAAIAAYSRTFARLGSSTLTREQTRIKFRQLAGR